MLSLEAVKAKSAKKLIGLHETVAEATELLIENCFKRGVAIQITQGLRTIAEQNALYAQGRTAPGSIVTNAKGGYSNHNFGVAIDFALLTPDGSKVTWDLNADYDNDKTTDWNEVVVEAKKLGFEWGGDWTNFKDYPHFQMTFGLTTAQYRTGIKPSQTEINKIKNIINTTKVVEETMKTLSKYFNDVYKDWQVSAIDGGKDKEIFAVPPDGTFKPDTPITRAEVAVIVERTINYVLTQVKK